MKILEREIELAAGLSWAAATWIAGHYTSVVGGAVGMGVANEMGLDPMPYAVGAAKWVIAAGEQALKQLPEKDGLSHSSEMPEAILSKK